VQTLCWLKTGLIFFLLGSSSFLQGQPWPEITSKKTAEKPFTISTNGRQFTIRCKQNLKSLLGWTSGGHRFIEEKNLNRSDYTFTVPRREKFFFLMIEMADGKRFTEKIGVP
jgi:hypothetical protein